jgi:wobble nucleotide-excising tRNase
MLRKLTTDVPFRAFREKPFDHGDSSCLLGRRTVIYGRNGSGKTSLSEMLRLGVTGKADSSVVTASLRQAGVTSTAKVGTAQFPMTVMVYNRYYVADALHDFLEGSGSSAVILKLGVVNVAAARELVEIANLTAERALLRKRVDDVRKSLAGNSESAEKDTKTDIISALSAGDAGKYNPTTYNVTRVRNLFSDASKTELAADLLATQTNMANASAMAPAPVPEALETLAKDLFTTINELLVEEVESEPISRLVEEPPLESWVEIGLELHVQGDMCKFCQRGIVTAETLELYRQHFSESLKSLQNRLREIIKDFEVREDDLANWEASIPSGALLLPDYRQAVADEAAAVSTAITDYRDRTTSILALLRERLTDTLEPLAADRLLTDAITLPDTTKFIRLIEDNNSACGSQGTRKTAAQTAVEEHFSAVHRDDYTKAKARVSLAERCIAAIDRRTKALKQREVELQQSQQDTHAMAVLIDKDLREHFGHTHLSVTVSEDGKGYVVRRGLGPAVMLSEGERNAIAFSYFMRTIEAEGVDQDKLVVVVDDPVTSLDKEALFAAFALADARTKKVAQTLFLTHDYEYFRLLLSSVKSRREKSERRIQDNNAEEMACPAVSVLETVAVVDPTTGIRTSEIRKVPSALLTHPTEYHYLFAKVAGGVTQNATDELPLLGNAARRLIEGFISFRAPHGSDFQKKIDAITLQNSIDGELSSRVVKFLHGHSHREDPSPISALDFPSIEAELKSVLEYMRLADGVHFKNMCIAVNIDESKLTARL